MRPDNDLAVVGLLLSAGVCESVSELLCESERAHEPTRSGHAGRRRSPLVLDDLPEVRH